jgi:hypothetical protein
MEIFIGSLAVATCSALCGTIIMLAVWACVALAGEIKETVKRDWK